MKVKASNVARILADLDLDMDDVIEVRVEPGKVSVKIVEDGQALVREFGVDLNA